MSCFTSFKRKDWLSLVLVIVAGFGWLLIDQLFLPEVYQRFIALLVILTGLFFLQFLLNRPVSPFRYANTITTICLSFIVIVSVILHVFIRKDFSFRSVLIWILTAILPYFAAFIYLLIKRDQKNG